MNCKKCGYENPDNIDVCESCGEQLACDEVKEEIITSAQTDGAVVSPVAETSMQAPQPATGKSKKKLITVLCLIVAIVIGIGGFLGIKITSAKKADEAAQDLAKKYITACSQADASKIKKYYPENMADDLYEENLDFEFLNMMMTSISVKPNVTTKVTSCEKLDKDDYNSLKKELKDKYDLKISDARKVVIKHNVIYSIPGYKAPEIYFTAKLKEVKIGSEWYICEYDIVCSSNYDE